MTSATQHVMSPAAKFTWQARSGAASHGAPRWTSSGRAVEKEEHRHGRERHRQTEYFHKAHHGQPIHDRLEQEQVKVIVQAVGDGAEDAQGRGAKEDGGGGKPRGGRAGRIFLGGGQERAGVVADAVGQDLQPQEAAEPVAEHNGDGGDGGLFEAGGESPMDVLINQPQPVEGGADAEGGLEEFLGAEGQWLAQGQAAERAEQDAEGVEECANHALIVSRFGGKGNEEKFAPRLNVQCNGRNG